MNNNHKIFLFILLPLLISSCSSYKVVSDIDSSEDFSQFKTYEFQGWSSNVTINRLDKERVEAAFVAEAKARGMEKVDADGDVIVALFFSGALRRQQTAQTTTTGMGTAGWGRRGMRSPGWGWGAANSTTVINETTYVEGALGVEMYDVADKKLIWHAVGTGTVKEDPKRRARDIPYKVKAIMKKYPVKPMKK